MPKIEYPFAAVPNQICRGGVGAINIAVLTALLSHGKTTASTKTLAEEIGCSRRSVCDALKYWIENGMMFGIEINSSERGLKTGVPTIYEVIVHKMETPAQPARKSKGTCATNAHPLRNNCAPTCATNAHKEEPIKKNPKEDSAPPSATRTGKREKIDPNTPMSLKEFIASCAESPQRHIQIIGNWAETVEPTHDTYGQWQVFLRRNLRAAKELEPFSDEKLVNAYDRIEQAIKEGYLKKFTLETLIKYAV